MNSVNLTGRLTRDSELRHTGSGSAFASFSLAVERPFKNGNGEKEVDFINVVAWRKTAEIITSFTRKGSLVGITGRIQTRNYTNNEGRKVYITEVVAEQVQLLEPKRTTESRSDSSEGNYARSNQNSSQGQKNGYQKQDEDPFEKNDSIQIDDDDLPFD